MRRRMYCIYDFKAEAPLNGFFQAFGTDAEATRHFRNIVSVPETMPGQHPEDFGLCFVGEVDFNTLVIERASAPLIPLIMGSDVVREIQRARNMDTSVPPAGNPAGTPPDIAVVK